MMTFFKASNETENYPSELNISNNIEAALFSLVSVKPTSLKYDAVLRGIPSAYSFSKAVGNSV